MNNIKSIESVCTTAEDLIKSEDFMRWVTIILEKVKTLDKDYILSLLTKLQNNENLNDEEINDLKSSTLDKNYILSLFTKLQNSEILDDREINDLKSFLSNDKVEKLWQKLLSKLKNISVNAKVNNIEEWISFFKLLNEISSEWWKFSVSWFRKIKSYVWEMVSNIINSNWFTPINISVNSREEEVDLENTNFRIDSSTWKEEERSWCMVKVNPQNDIIEYKSNGWVEQLFTYNAMIRETELRKLRAPSADDTSPYNPKLHTGELEFKKIFEKVWDKKINTPASNDVIFWTKDSFWSSTTIDENRAIVVSIWRSIDDINFSYIAINKDRFFHVRCIKDGKRKIIW